MADTTDAEIDEILWGLAATAILPNKDGSIIDEAKAKLKALLLRERKEADNKGHLIGFKNGKWAITSSLGTWIKKRARVTNVQNIDGIRNGQYIRVDELEAELSRLSGEESHE